jgi:hypothetical protein
VYIKFVGYNLKFSHLQNAYNLWLTKNISYIFVVLFTIHLHPKFHMTKSKGSLLTVTKPKAKHRFLAAAMLLLYIVQNSDLKELYVFWRSITICTFRAPYLMTLPAHKFMCHVETDEYGIGVASNGTKFKTNFVKIGQLFRTLKGVTHTEAACVMRIFVLFP